MYLWDNYKIVLQSAAVRAHCRCMQLLVPPAPRPPPEKLQTSVRCKQTALSWAGPVESLPSAVSKLGFFSESLKQSNKIQFLTILLDHSCGLTLPLVSGCCTIIVRSQIDTAVLRGWAAAPALDRPDLLHASLWYQLLPAILLPAEAKLSSAWAVSSSQWGASVVWRLQFSSSPAYFPSHQLVRFLGHLIVLNDIEMVDKRPEFEQV